MHFQRLQDVSETGPLRIRGMSGRKMWSVTVRQERVVILSWLLRTYHGSLKKRKTDRSESVGVMEALDSTSAYAVCGQ